MKTDELDSILENKLDTLEEQYNITEEKLKLIKEDDKKIWEHAHYLRIKNEMKKLAAAEAKKKDKASIEIEEF